MTQEDKDILLKDLGARLSYKVVAQVSYKDGEGWKTEDRKVLGVYTDEQVYVDCVYTNIENIKPYLRPMSSMTEKEVKEFELLGWRVDELDDNSPWAHCGSIGHVLDGIDWLNAHHFDYCDLIEKGLAIEVTPENNPYK